MLGDSDGQLPEGVARLLCGPLPITVLGVARPVEEHHDPAAGRAARPDRHVDVQQLRGGARIARRRQVARAAEHQPGVVVVRVEVHRPGDVGAGADDVVAARLVEPA